MQDQLVDCRLLIIDDKSIIEAQILYRTDRRLRSIRCNHNNIFEGIDILFYGDLGPLPPIMIYTFNNTLSSDKEDVQADLGVYTAIDQTVVLSQIIHQRGTSAEAVRFRDTLNGLRIGPISPIS